MKLIPRLSIFVGLVLTACAGSPDEITTVDDLKVRPGEFAVGATATVTVDFSYTTSLGPSNLFSLVVHLPAIAAFESSGSLQSSTWEVFPFDISHHKEPSAVENCEGGDSFVAYNFIGGELASGADDEVSDSGVARVSFIIRGEHNGTGLIEAKADPVVTYGCEKTFQRDRETSFSVSR